MSHTHTGTYITSCDLPLNCQDNSCRAMFEHTSTFRKLELSVQGFIGPITFGRTLAIIDTRQCRSSCIPSLKLNLIENNSSNDYCSSTEVPNFDDH